MRTRSRIIAACVFGFVAILSARVFAQVTAVSRIAMIVDDMDRSVDFYSRALDFKKTSDIEIAGEDVEKRLNVFGARVRVVEMTLGSETIELDEFLTPRGALIPRESRSNDGWFQHVAIVTTDMDRAYARLRENKARHASTGPQTLPTWNNNAAGIKAFYFRDPDDHNLEVIHFPQGKGDPRWQGKTELFAGIDHTAIVVKNTEQSLKFYRDVLGMRVAGNSENYGTEQEHLNNVAGAHLKITGLRAASGPGVELLEYIAPTDGRPYPTDAKMNDLFAWRTTMTSADVAGLLHDLQEKGFRVTPSQSSVIARDADGHFVEITRNAAHMESPQSK